MRRQWRTVEIRLTVPDVAGAGRALANAAEAPLSLRVRDDGRVRAVIAEFSRFSSPPVLAGRINPDPGGAVLAATVHESYAEVLIPRVFLGSAVWLGAALAWLLIDRQFSSPGVPICAIGAVVLGLMGLALGRLRGTGFRRHADDLERAVRELVAASGTERSQR